MADHVAIVGLACRYPEADNPTQLWQNIMARRRSFRPLPARRLPLSDYGGTGPDDVYVTHAAVLDGWAFDRRRFRVPGETFRAVDLTHWLALDVSAAALADAGIPDATGVDRRRVGVVLGNSLTGEFSRAALLRTRWPYVRRAVAAALSQTALADAERADLLTAIEQRYKAAFPAPSDETLAGALANTIAGRICNHFDLQGTGFTVDGACASSLLAVSTAAGAVAQGQLDVALAGGVDLSLDPFELVGFSRLGALARAEMRIYDRRPTGFLPGEGCGVIVLCRESYARRRGLRVYARVLGWGSSSDGGGGLTRPELAGQHLALTRAYTGADLAPQQVAMIEGHGTGTEVGDTTELRTLLAVRGDGAPRAVLGSVKANIGHTKAAAGVAGLIKATLAVHREVIPPTTGCVAPHPLLTEASASLEIAGEARAWAGPRRFAAVSAMGFGGINTHVVLGDAEASARRRISRHERRLATRHPDYELIVCSAERADELVAQLGVIHRGAGEMSRGELTDLAATLAQSASGGAPARFAAAVTQPAELIAAIDDALDGLGSGQRRLAGSGRRSFLAVGAPLRIGLLFTGQAAPCYPDAGALADLLDDAPIGYDDEWVGDGGAPVDTATAQPAIMRASLAGLRWLDTLGVRAHQALGHSLGEISALVWAGALTEVEAYQLAKERGAAMAAASTIPAGMASLRADLATVEDLIRGHGVVVAADNAELSVVISGPLAELRSAVAAARRRGVAATWLPVAQAFHSPLMAAATERLHKALARVAWQPGRPIASSVTARWHRDGDPTGLLLRQLTAPVRFREALGLLDADLLVEVGPGQILAGLAAPARTAIAMDAGGRSAGLATATAALFAAGAFDSAEPYFARRFTRRFDPARPRLFLANPCELAPADQPPLGSGSATAQTAGGPEAPARGASALASAPPVTPAPARLAAATEVTAQATEVTATEVPASASAAVVVSPESARAAVRARVAAAVELDESEIPPRARLMVDLHLSSLRLAQVAATVAADLGRSMPAGALPLASATVEELADAIAALPAADPATEAPTGVAPWVRAFGQRLVARPTMVPTTRRHWMLVGDLDEHPLAEEIRATFRIDPAGADAPAGAAATRLLALPPGLRTVPADDIVAALRASADDGTSLVVLHHGGIGAAVGRSLAAEHPDVAVLVVEAQPDGSGIRHAADEAHRAFTSYTEVVFDRDGRRTVPRLRPIRLEPRRDAAIPLAPGEVCLITGGAKGIGLECAEALASATGARLVLLGRSPADAADVLAARGRLAATGVAATYCRVDVRDATAVAVALAEVGRGYGPVRALLHAAGGNEPVAITGLTSAKLLGTLAPKVSGLENVLAALDLSALRLAVTFGSVIGRIGLAGEADYAIANEWLARRCAELSQALPHVRWLNIEWSVWAGTGMGARLGVLDALTRQGVSPIPVESGVAALLRALATSSLPPTILVSGRLPATPTARWDEADAVSGRFLEVQLSHTPGVELVAEASLAEATDPYLADHRIDGTLVLPAVVGLEAMAQACQALAPRPLPATWHDVALASPVTLAPREPRRLRLAALAREDGAVDVVARSEETGFSVEHFRAVRAAPSAATPDPPTTPEPPTTPDSEAAPGAGTESTVAGIAGDVLAARHLYGPLFFHGERFQRVLGYRALSAYRCLAEIAAEPGTRWFSGFHDQRLELGDPGARDAFLHALQACVPDRRVLPVAVERIVVHRQPEGRLTLDARQLAEAGELFTFDLTVHAGDSAGDSLVEEWRGLSLRAIGPLRVAAWPVELLGPYLARTLRRWRPELALDIAVAPAWPSADQTGSIAAWLDPAHGAPAAVARASRLDDRLLVAAGTGIIGVAWTRLEPPGGAVAPVPDPGLVEEVARRTGESRPVAALRVRGCEALLRGAGLAPDEPLRAQEAGPAGWLRLTCRDAVLYSAVAPTSAGTVAACLGFG